MYDIGVLFIFGISLFIGIGGCAYFRLTPRQFAIQGLRVIAAYLFAWLYRQDRREVEALCRTYRRGLAASREDAHAAFSQFPKQEESRVDILFSHASLGDGVPFVYESPDAPHLRELRECYRLRELIDDAENEYDAMLRLGAWVGTRWDHGTDAVPGGSAILNPVAVIQAGERGAKFWCEIAAKTLVLAATSLGWVARLTTTSRDGYTWEHAVAELWSNQFCKWFVIDPDFNVVYESDGVPLSAFELCHRSEALTLANQLSVRLIAGTKRSLPLADILPFYAYTHIEMRTDWHTRRLRRGSPAGGDLQTWWTARTGFRPLLTVKVRNDRSDLFDWQVNTVMVSAYHLEKLGEQETVLRLGFIGYSPYFERFQACLDDDLWQESASGMFSFNLTPGEHTLKARVVTLSGEPGPIYEGRILDRRKTNTGRIPDRRQTKRL